MENNKLTMAGVVIDGFTFDHKAYGEKFYKGMLSVVRDSGTADIIPVMVSEVLLQEDMDYAGKFISISGEYRSRNIHLEKKNVLDLYVFVKELSEAEMQVPLNLVELQGFVCKKPIYRKTPLGREICDLLLAVNTNYGRSQYIPCITWGRNAIKAESFEVGDKLSIRGRVQSREYQKNLDDGTSEKRIAYEVSASNVELSEDDE